MRRQLPADDQVTAVWRVYSPRQPGTGIRQRAQQQAGTARPARPVSAGNDPDAVMQRLRRDNEDLRRLVKIYAESIRQLTLGQLELEAKLNTAVGVTTLADRRNR